MHTAQLKLSLLILAFQVWLDVTNDSTQAPRVSTTSIFMKVSRMTMESANQTAAKQPTPATQKSSSRKKSSPTRRKVPTKPAASDPVFVDSSADINLFAEVSEPPQKYEGFICPICKGNMETQEDLLKHQPFCPGVREDRSTRASASDVSLPTYNNTVCPVSMCYVSVFSHCFDAIKYCLFVCPVLTCCVSVFSHCFDCLQSLFRRNQILFVCLSCIDMLCVYLQCVVCRHDLSRALFIRKCFCPNGL